MLAFPPSVEKRVLATPPPWATSLKSEDRLKTAVSGPGAGGYAASARRPPANRDATFLVVKLAGDDDANI